MNPFGIAPLLDRGALRLDPYERFLIAKIKSGQYCPDLWNCNGLHLGYEERTGAPVYLADAVLQRWRITPQMAEFARKDREERKAKWQAEAPERARRAAERKAEKEAREAEWARVQQEWALKREEKAKQEAERAAEWEREEAARKARTERIVAEQLKAAEKREAERKAAWQAREAAAEAAYEAETIVLETQSVELKASVRAAQRRRILAAPWQCKKCLKPATIEPHLGGFRLKCLPCAESTFGAHELLARVVEAQAA